MPPLNLSIPLTCTAAVAAIDVMQYDWIHFEGSLRCFGRSHPLSGRNVDVTLATLAHVRARIAQSGRGPRVSVELEKPRDSLVDMVQHADLVRALLCPPAIMPAGVLQQGLGETERIRHARGLPDRHGAPRTAHVRTPSPRPNCIIAAVLSWCVPGARPARRRSTCNRGSSAPRQPSRHQRACRRA